MRRVFWLVAAALLLAGCAGEKGIVEKEGYQLDTRRQAQAAYPRIKVLVIHYTADDFDSSLATLTDIPCQPSGCMRQSRSASHWAPRMFQVKQ